MPTLAFPSSTSFPKFGSMKPPKRVQILSTTDSGYFKKGQFAYVVGWDERGGMYWLDRPGRSSAGEKAYLVSKTKDLRGGALWFSKDALRFTKRRGR